MHGCRTLTPWCVRHLLLPSTFYLQIRTFTSGADGIRTHALRRAKAKKCILVRPGTSGYFAVLQVLYGIASGDSSMAYGSVLARLQYIHSTIPV
jgi:hypothetical protein